MHILGYEHPVNKIKEDIPEDVDVIFSKDKVHLSIHKVRDNVHYKDDSDEVQNVNTYVDDQTIEGPVAILGIDVGEDSNIEPDVIETKNKEYNNYRRILCEKIKKNKE